MFEIEKFQEPPIYLNDKNSYFKLMDLGLYLVYPCYLRKDGYKKQVIMVRSVITKMIYNKIDHKIKQINYIAKDNPEQWFTRVGKINKYSSGKILTTEDRIDEAVQTIQKHLRDLHYEEYQKYNEDLYDTVVYK